MNKWGMFMKNYYELLEVSITAKPEEIRKAMQKKAERGQIDLLVLEECKKYLLNSEERKEYNKALFMEQPELLEEVARVAQQKGDKDEQENQIEKIAVIPDETSKMGGRSKLGIVGKIGGSFLLICFVMMLFSKPSKPKLDEWTAQVSCESAVKQLLKSPSTAEFSGWIRVLNSDGTYTVTGNVDAQNSFGAMLRSSFSCTVRDKGDSTTGTIVNYLK